MLGTIEGRRRRGQQRMRQLDGIIDSMDNELEQILGDSEGQGNLACFSPWDRTEPDTTEQQQYYLLTIQISQSFMLCPLFVFIGLHIVFSCTEQFQLHATNSGKILFIFILLQLFSSFPCYGFLDTPII